MRTIVTIGLVVGSLALSGTASYAMVHYVDCGGGDYLTIQEAVNAASNGDTIRVAQCVYTEQVEIPAGVGLTFEGSGEDVTELTWSGSGATLTFVDRSVKIEDMTIRRAPETAEAISWYGGRLSLLQCKVFGLITGGPPIQYGPYVASVDVRQSQASVVSATGAGASSIIEHSRIGDFSVSGVHLLDGHTLESSDSFYGTLEYGALVDMTSLRDSIGHMEVPGGLDVLGTLEADQSTIGTLIGNITPRIRLNTCILGDVTYDGWTDIYYGGSLEMYSCLVTGDFSVLPPWTKVCGTSRDSHNANNYVLGFELLHNTFLGDFSFTCDFGALLTDRDVRSNIVAGMTDFTVSFVTNVTHNDFVGGLTYSGVLDSVHSNIEADPQFCDAPSGDYTISECSPCAGTAHDGGDIGAFGVGCDCSVAIRSESWGDIKALLK